MRFTLRQRIRRLAVNVTGGFELHFKGFQPFGFPTRKAEALLTYLLLSRNGIATRDELRLLLWGGVPAEQGQHSLRQALSEVRLTLLPYGSHFIQTTRRTVAVNFAAIRVDALLIERLLKRDTLGCLRLTCELWQGELFGGMDVKEPAFARWLAPQRTRIRRLGVEAHERYVRALQVRGEHGQALATAQRLVSIDPLYEPGHRLLMSLYVTRGDVAAAFQQYDSCVAILDRELGLQPDAETQQARRELDSLRRRTGRIDRGQAADATPGAGRAKPPNAE